MKTRLTSIALTLAGVTVLGLTLANSGGVNASANKDNGNQSTNNVQIPNENLSNDKEVNRRCCDLNLLEASIVNDENPNDDGVRAVNDDYLRSSNVTNSNSPTENRNQAENQFRRDNTQA